VARSRRLVEAPDGGGDGRHPEEVGVLPGLPGDLDHRVRERIEILERLRLRRLDEHALLDAVVDEALRGLKEKADGVPSPETIRRLRTKLKLSQREAGALFRVGENAFDKYERGLIEPSGPTIQLMALLDRHPELVAELK